MYSFEKDYWNHRYSTGGNSGYGSYGEQLQKKIDWLKPLKFKSVVELGCGDFNFGLHILLDHEASYTGYDISEMVIQQNRELYPHLFKVYEGHLQPAELVVCVDVLFHIISDDDYQATLDELFRVWQDPKVKYLVLSAYERDEYKDNHVRIRAFDYKRFGEPMLREVVEEDGQLYFYIFKKQTWDQEKEQKDVGRINIQGGLKRDFSLKSPLVTV